MRYVKSRLRGLSAPILSGSAAGWNARKAGGLGWSVRAGGPYSGVGDSKLARDLYCFIHDTNMLRKALGPNNPDWPQVQYCDGACNPDVAQGTKDHNCYNRDGMLGERSIAEIANVIGVHLDGDTVAFPSGRDWGEHWYRALDLSRTRCPPSAGKRYPVPSASGPAGWVVQSGQQQTAVEACVAQGNSASTCAPPPPPDAAPPPPAPPAPPLPPRKEKKPPAKKPPAKKPPAKKPPAKPPTKSNTGVVVGLMAAAAGAYYLTQA
jgi:hypothetical protein